MSERRLVTAAWFGAQARKGAKADDFGDVSVFLPGRIVRQKAGAGDAAARTIGFILSNANLDREGDSIAINGWDLVPYRANPVVLWAHSHDGLPVARALKTYIEGGQLKALDKFVAADVYPFADTVYQMLLNGDLNACSVGFQPSEWEMTDSGVNFQKQTLLEHSVCPVPAHPEALVISRSATGRRALVQWCEEHLDTFTRPGDAADEMRRDIGLLRISASSSKLVAVRRTVSGGPAEDATLATMGELLASCGTSLSMAAAAIEQLRGMPEAAGTPAGPDADEEAADVQQLTIIAANCGAVSDAAGTCATMAITMGGAPGSTPKALTRSTARVVRSALVRLRASLRGVRSTSKAGRVLSAANEAALRAAVDAITSVLAQLDAGQEQAHLVVDGRRLAPDVDDLSEALADISEKELNEILARAIADEFMKTTGKVW